MVPGSARRYRLTILMSLRPGVGCHGRLRATRLAAGALRFLAPALDADPLDGRCASPAARRGRALDADPRSTPIRARPAGLDHSAAAAILLTLKLNLTVRSPCLPVRNNWQTLTI
jgi:hypothetical protein